jgi:hypothetical protein
MDKMGGLNDMCIWEGNIKLYIRKIRLKYLDWNRLAQARLTDGRRNTVMKIRFHKMRGISWLAFKKDFNPL